MPSDKFTKNSRSSLFSSGFLYATLGNLANVGLGAVYWILIASMTSPESYGFVSFVLSIPSLLSVLGILGLNVFIINYQSKSSKTKSIIGAYQISFISTFLLTLFFLFLGNPVISLVLIGEVAYLMTYATIISKQRYRFFFLYIISMRFVQIITTLFLFSLFSEFGIIIGYGLPLLLFGLPYFYFAFQKAGIFISELRPFSAFISHAFGSNATLGVRTYLDKIIVGLTFGLSILGLYQLAFQFFMLVMFLPNAIFQIILPKEESAERTIRDETPIILVSFVCTLVSLILFPIILLWLFPSYFEAITMVQIVALTFIPTTIAWSSSAVLYKQGKSRYPLVASVIQAGVEVGLLIPLGLFLGTAGLAIAIFLGQISMALYLIIIRHWKL